MCLLLAAGALGRKKAGAGAEERVGDVRLDEDLPGLLAAVVTDQYVADLLLTSLL